MPESRSSSCTYQRPLQRVEACACKAGNARSISSVFLGLTFHVGLCTWRQRTDNVWCRFRKYRVPTSGRVQFELRVISESGVRRGIRTATARSADSDPDPNRRGQRASVATLTSVARLAIWNRHIIHTTIHNTTTLSIDATFNATLRRPPTSTAHFPKVAGKPRTVNLKHLPRRTHAHTHTRTHTHAHTHAHKPSL